MRIRQVTAVVLGLTALWVPSLRSQQMEPGGSNYLAYYVSPSYVKGFHSPGGWGDGNPVWVTWARQLFAPGGFMHVVGDYHLHPDVVRSQLREMYAGGQRKLSILM